MQVIMDISIIATKENGGDLTLRKIHEETSVHPIPGARVEDLAWKEPKVPVSYFCNFDKNYYLLKFKSVSLDTKERCEAEGKMYGTHGWKSPSEFEVK